MGSVRLVSRYAQYDFSQRSQAGASSARISRNAASAHPLTVVVDAAGHIASAMAPAALRHDPLIALHGTSSDSEFPLKS